MKLIIDTHLDLAWNALSWNRDLKRPLEEINREEAGMTDDDARGHATTCLPELRRARVAVCLATIQARTKPEVRPADGFNRQNLDYKSADITCAVGQGQLAYYRLLEEQGEVRMLHTAADLERHWAEWQAEDCQGLPVGMILAMEGADPIVSPAQAAVWFRDGLRSVSLAHYGMSRYAAGTSASGGLTPQGVRLLEEFQRLGIILDVTHLSDDAFFEALDRFPGPVMASHNNCRALVPGQRQFSDPQIRRLAARGAIIGVAMDAWMLYPDWKIDRVPREAVRLEAVVDHIDHICQLTGDCRHAAIGSDLDGGYGTEQTPFGLDTIADLQKLAGILSDRGYADEDIDAVFHGNWLGFFRRSLPQ
ncbi:MAG: membrane dipeptidase [Pirellulales bacterium]|nr:membrane dipeptidase [Pirellulales bacterium]